MYIHSHNFYSAVKPSFTYSRVKCNPHLISNHMFQGTSALTTHVFSSTVLICLISRISDNKKDWIQFKQFAILSWIPH